MESLLLNKVVFVFGLGIMCQWIAWKLRIPAIIFLSVTGVLLGPTFGLISPSEDFGDLIEVLVKLALAIILFDGGLNLRLSEFKKSPRALRRLVSAGVILSWIFGSVSFRYLLDFSWAVATVMSSILIVTGPTVIMPLLKQTNLSRKMSSLFKWEGIVNDPIGALITVLLFEFWIHLAEGKNPSSVFASVAAGVVVAFGLGVATGFAIKYLFRKAHAPEYLKVPIILASVVVLYSVSNLVQEEAGLLAVTVLGFVMGNVRLSIIHELRRFKEQITVFLVSAVFIILTSELDFAHFNVLDAKSIIFCVLALFFVRPLAIVLSTFRTEMNFKERLLLGWIAPRGVVAATMAGLVAPKMIEVGYEGAEYILAFIFLIVFITVLVHGVSLPILARFMGLASKSKSGMLIVGSNPVTTDLARVLMGEGVQILLVDNSWTRLSQARLSGVNVHYGEILSEDSEDELDLSEMGVLLAGTDNDAYNAFVCSTFAHEFGRNKVFQFAMHDLKANKEGYQGQGLIASSIHLYYETLVSRFYRGWRFRKDTIETEEQFKELVDGKRDKREAFLMLTKTGEIIVNNERDAFSFKGASTLISYASPEELGS